MLTANPVDLPELGSVVRMFASAGNQGKRISIATAIDMSIGRQWIMVELFEKRGIQFYLAGWGGKSHFFILPVFSFPCTYPCAAEVSPGYSSRRKDVVERIVDCPPGPIGPLAASLSQLAPEV